MKQNIIFILSLIALTVLTFSCKKDNTVQPTKQEISAKDQAITQKILDFKQKLFAHKDKPNAKDGQAMTIDSAVWYSEALLNYSNANAGTERKNFTTTSDTLIVPSTNGQITYANLYGAYAEMETMLSTRQNENPDADLVLADVKNIGENGGNTTFVLNSGFGDDGGIEMTNYNWYWGFQFGTCDSPPQFVGWDAARIIKQFINFNISVPLDGYYTSIDDIHFNKWGYQFNNDPWVYGNFFHNPNWQPSMGENWLKYLVFVSDNSYYFYHDCLFPEETNTYCNIGYYLVSYVIPQQLVLPWMQEKNLIGCHIEGKGWFPFIWHEGYSSYGIFVYTGGGG